MVEAVPVPVAEIGVMSVATEAVAGAEIGDVLVWTEAVEAGLGCLPVTYVVRGSLPDMMVIPPPPSSLGPRAASSSSPSWSKSCLEPPCSCATWAVGTDARRPRPGHRRARRHTQVHNTSAPQRAQPPSGPDTRPPPQSPPPQSPPPQTPRGPDTRRILRIGFEVLITYLEIGVERRSSNRPARDFKMNHNSLNQFSIETDLFDSLESLKVSIQKLNQIIQIENNHCCPF